jgi:hypothetical protein
MSSPISGKLDLLRQIAAKGDDLSQIEREKARASLERARACSEPVDCGAMQ